MITGFHHAAIICGDIARSRKFYTEVLGLTILAETYRADRDSWKIDLRLPCGGQIELFTFPGAPERPTRPEALGLRHLAFAVDSVAAAKTKLERAGVTVEPIRLDTLTNRPFTFFADPDGLPLELYQSTPSKAQL